MKKKTVKRPSSSRYIPERIRMIIRSFAISHKDGYDDRSLALLKAYLHDKKNFDLDKKGLKEEVTREAKGIKTEAVLREIDSILFSTKEEAAMIKLGSPFCRDCGMFKNHRKECPYCGYHEMTV